MPRRWYQTIIIKDLDMVFEDINRKDSKFWNEGKFNNFIKPLLPKERQSFLEIGCNAGLFLKMAAEEGFKNIIGVEGNRQIMEQAHHARKAYGGDYELIQQRVGLNFDLDQVRLSDVVLMSNMHYYIGVPQFARLVEDLRNRCLYCIVVSARAKRRQGNALWDLHSVRGYFRDWEEIELITDLDDDTDISPRPQMFGILFKGNLSTIDVDVIYDTWELAARKPKHRSHGLPPALEEFYGKIVAGKVIDYEKTLLYEYWLKREHKRTEKHCINRLLNKEATAKDIIENGMKTPIYYVRKHGQLRDGLHRLCLAKQLGQKYVLGKLI